MRYVAITLLALLGLIELPLRAIVAVCTIFLAPCMEDNFFHPWCFRMAELVLRYEG